MTQDEILEMVREAGGSDVGGHGWTTWVGTQSTEFLERFAKLVADKAAAKEREACAKLCEEMESSAALAPIEKYRTNFIAAAIRARGEQT